LAVVEAEMQIVIDTNVLMDAMKSNEAIDDGLADEAVAAGPLLGMLLSEREDLLVAYAQGMLVEWNQKKLFEEDMVLRTLEDLGRLVLLKPKRLSKGQKADLGPYVAHDDQVFVLTAAEIRGQKKKPCVTRDPRTTSGASRKYVKAKFDVTVLLASEFVADA
jgi:hypothetical protein